MVQATSRASLRASVLRVCCNLAHQLLIPDFQLCFPFGISKDESLLPTFQSSQSRDVLVVLERCGNRLGMWTERQTYLEQCLSQTEPCSPLLSAASDSDPAGSMW